MLSPVADVADVRSVLQLPLATHLPLLASHRLPATQSAAVVHVERHAFAPQT